VAKLRLPQLLNRFNMLILTINLNLLTSSLYNDTIINKERIMADKLIVTGETKRRIANLEFPGMG
jgi:hypothetical protein